MWQIHFTKKYYIFILRRWEYKFVFNHILVFSFIKLLVGIFKVSYGATKHMIEDMPTWWKICRQLAKVEEDHECVICQREKATRTWNLWKLKPAESQSLLTWMKAVWALLLHRHWWNCFTDQRVLGDHFF